jgi:arylsulfatase A-like enzyme
VQRHAPFLGRSVPVVTRSEFRSSGFTGAHLRDVPFEGWSTPAVLVERCRTLVAAGNPLVYSYYPGVDTVAHEFGLAAPYLAAELAFADELVGRLLDALAPEVALVVTADHGQVEVEEWVDLAPLGPLVTGASGEGRFRWIEGPRGAGDELAAAAADAFGHQAWVRTREEVIEAGWLGPPHAGATHRRRLGDVALVPFAPVGFVDPAMPRERHLVGAHGSLTSAEMLVPLLAGRGRGPAR